VKETPRGPDQGRRRPETVASIGAFDLDDFHAEIGQHLSAEGFGKKRCEIEHSNTSRACVIFPPFENVVIFFRGKSGSLFHNQSPECKKKFSFEPVE